MVDAHAGGTDLVSDGSVLVEHDHPAVDGVSDCDLTVLEQVGVIRLVQVSRAAARMAGMSVGPEDMT